MDVAVVNGSFGGYEIKSDRDTLGRLPVQVEQYSAVLDYAVLVVGRRHVEKAVRMVPVWWGVMVAEPGSTESAPAVLTQFRPAEQNPSVDPQRLVQLLWRDETLAELEERGLAQSCRSKPRQALWERLAASLPPDELRAVVRERLKSRPGWRSA